MSVDLHELSRDIHARNVNAGWWNDLKTGEFILETRNRPELMMLVVSEITEADDGMTESLMDDKLPHLPMFSVEISDVVIRLLDMLGAETSLHGGMDFNFASAIAEAEIKLTGKSHERRLLAIVNEVSHAMEHIRKGRIQAYREAISVALATTMAVAELSHIDLYAVIDEKLNFNANRSDHKISNRILDGGKKF